LKKGCCHLKKSLKFRLLQESKINQAEENSRTEKAEEAVISAQFHKTLRHLEETDNIHLEIKGKKTN
jgi:hypothetical protein